MYGYGYYSMFDPTMILVLIGVFLSLGASAKVKGSTFTVRLPVAVQP